MATDALLQPPRANRGGTSVGLTAILAVAAVGGGLYLASHRPERRAPGNEDTLAEIAALARVEKDAEWLKRAIRDRRAILGMTYREVEMAKGPPHLKQRGDTLPDMHRAKGGVEYWIYELGGGEVSDVLFGVNGLVIHASDVAGKSRDGHAIRQ